MNERQDPLANWPVIEIPQTPIDPNDHGAIRAAEEIVKWANGQLGVAAERPRADRFYNPDDVFICVNGHLQYNLCEQEKQEMRERGEKPLPICYEGGLCRHCTELLEKLTADPKHLQYKLSTYMAQCAQLRGTLAPLQAVNADTNKIALFLRENYQHEMESGQVQHLGNGALSTAVIHYLRIERGRAGAKLARLWRGIMRVIGVRW